MMAAHQRIGARKVAGPLRRAPRLCWPQHGGRQAPVDRERQEGRALEFNFFRAHNNSELGGVLMPLTGAIPEGRSFFCPHCGALYAVTYSRLSNSDSNVARCVVCGQIMDKWDSTKVPTFKLIHRPEDH